jgi:hypothetical protein
MTNQSSGRSEDVRRSLEQNLRNLALNMNAICKGDGNPGELVDQIVKLAESLIAYNETYGTVPEEELIRRALANVVEPE